MTAHRAGMYAVIIALNLFSQCDEEALARMVLSATINAMSNTPPSQLRVFAFKDVVRFGRKFHISDKGIWDMVRSQPDADLGGGLYKYRIARSGEGSRGGGRV